MWRPLIKPDRLTVLGPAREHTACPFIIPRSRIRIPWSRIASSIKKQILLKVIGDEPPHRPSAQFPSLRRPGRHAQVLSTIRWIKWLELRSDQAFRIWPRLVRPPRDL